MAALTPSLRATLALLLLCLGLGVHAQGPKQPTPEEIRKGLQGCWYGGDGGTEGRYCFTEDKLTITPDGSGRITLEREWSVDAKGTVVVRSGKHRITYTVEHLAEDGFVLVNDKEKVRLEGHREKPKKR